MIKLIFKPLLALVSALAIIFGLTQAPASASPSPTELYFGGPAGDVNNCGDADRSTAVVGIYTDSAHNTPATALSGTGGSVLGHNDCTYFAVYYTLGTSDSGSLTGQNFGVGSTTTMSLNSSGTFTLYRCDGVGATDAVAAGHGTGSAGSCTDPSTRASVATLSSTITAGGGGGGAPTIYEGSSTVTTFTASAPTPVFTVNSVHTITAPQMGMSLRVYNSDDNSSWAVNSGCATTGANSLASCFITSVKVNGLETSATARRSTSGSTDSINLLFSSMTSAGSTYEVTFAAGAFTAPAAGTNKIRLGFGPTNSEVAVILGSAPAAKTTPTAPTTPAKLKKGAASTIAMAGGKNKNGLVTVVTSATPKICTVAKVTKKSGKVTTITGYKVTTKAAGACKLNFAMTGNATYATKTISKTITVTK